MPIVKVRFKLTDSKAVSLIEELNKDRKYAVDIARSDPPLKIIDINVANAKRLAKERLVKPDFKRFIEQITQNLSDFQRGHEDKLAELYTDIYETKNVISIRSGQLKSLMDVLKTKTIDFANDFLMLEQLYETFKKDFDALQAIFSKMYPSYDAYKLEVLGWDFNTAEMFAGEEKQAQYISQPPLNFPDFRVTSTYFTEAQFMMYTLKKISSNIHKAACEHLNPSKPSLLSCSEADIFKSWMEGQCTELDRTLDVNALLMKKAKKINSEFTAGFKENFDSMQALGIKKINNKYEDDILRNLDEVEEVAHGIIEKTQKSKNPDPKLNIKRLILGTNMSQSLLHFCKNMREVFKDTTKNWISWPSRINRSGFISANFDKKMPTELPMVWVDKFTITYQEDTNKPVKELTTTKTQCGLYSAYPILYNDAGHFSRLAFRSVKSHMENVYQKMAYPFTKYKIDLGESDIEVSMQLLDALPDSIKNSKDSTLEVKANECTIALLGGNRVHLSLSISEPETKKAKEMI